MLSLWDRDRYRIIGTSRLGLSLGSKRNSGKCLSRQRAFISSKVLMERSSRVIRPICLSSDKIKVTNRQSLDLESNVLDTQQLQIVVIRVCPFSGASDQMSKSDHT